MLENAGATRSHHCNINLEMQNNVKYFDSVYIHYFGHWMVGKGGYGLFPVLGVSVS